ncbi:MAG: MBL fold metallo-hydrolase [Chloroflexi bacterium]|nr:MBL fold metallo-hydrolase [Chloroflexota bacterium]
MGERIELAPVDRVEVTTLYDNLVDASLPGGGAVERLTPEKGAPLVSTLLAEEKRNPFVGGHGLAMQVTVTRAGVSRSLLFDAGGSPDGLVHNLDCLGLQPKDWNCIVLSHGHWDHTLGLIGLHERLRRLDFPLTLHPDAYLTRVNVYPDGSRSRTVPPSRQGLRDAGLELVETMEPSFVLEGMVLVTGQVARTNDYETGAPAHHKELSDGTLEPDPLICDDQGLVINVAGKGLVVLSGCGHAGIVNTVQHARAITGVPTVHAIVGGFHLGPGAFQARIPRVVEALATLEPAIIAPTHCTGYRAMFQTYHALPDAYVQNTVGTRISVGSVP